MIALIDLFHVLHSCNEAHRHVHQVLAASVANTVYGTRAPSRMLRVEGPPVRYQDCKLKFGPWPPNLPKGSTAWSDGQHANMSSFFISFTPKVVKGIETEWVSFLTKDKKTPSYAKFAHGTITGRMKSKVIVSPTSFLLPSPFP